MRILRISDGRHDGVAYGQFRTMLVTMRPRVEPGTVVRMVSVSGRRLRTTTCDTSRPIGIYSNQTVIINNRLLKDDEKEGLARSCGFECFGDWFQHLKGSSGIPVEGDLITWL